MKLDDRPVIDQLLNPTPLNILKDVRLELADWHPLPISEAHQEIEGMLADEVKSLDLDLSAETLADLTDALRDAAGSIAEWIDGVAEVVVNEMSNRLEDRL